MSRSEPFIGAAQQKRNNHMSEHSNRSSSLSDSDQMALFWIAPIALTVALGSAGLWWSKALTWLVDHSILIAADASPIVRIPAAQGIGLDGRRATIALALVIAVVAIGISAGKAAHSARQTRPQKGDRG